MAFLISERGGAASRKQKAAPELIKQLSPGASPLEDELREAIAGFDDLVAVAE